MLPRTTSIWQRDSRPNASGRPGAVQFDWEGTPAVGMFKSATIAEDGRRYATQRGIAFEAKPTADGSWHGFPIPWESVPAAVKDGWLDKELVKGSQVKRYLSRPEKDIKWALDSDDE